MSNTDVGLCLEENEYVRNKVRWVVSLANGLTVYEDNDSAWYRLKAYCLNEQTHIVEMWLQFRSHRVLVEPRDAEGYFLIKSVCGVWGDSDNRHAYIVGAMVNGEIHATRWQVPELQKMDTCRRNENEESPSLICRKNLTK